MRAGGAILLTLAAIAVLPATASAGGGPPPRFCTEEVVQDYLAAAKGRPKQTPFPVGELPRRFGPLGLDMSPPLELPNTGQVLGPTFRFFGAEDRVSLDLDLTFTLTRFDGPRSRNPIVKRVRLRSLSDRSEPTLGIRVSNQPALYRIEMEARDGSGRKLGTYGQYSRMVPRKSKPRLILGETSLRPGDLSSIGVAEFGTGYLVFEPKYTLEAFDGVNWVPSSAIEARTPSNLFSPLANSGSVAVCSKLAVPAATPPGRYRISLPVQHRWGTPRSNPFRSVLSAEFTVGP